MFYVVILKDNDGRLWERTIIHHNRLTKAGKCDITSGSDKDNIYRSFYGIYYKGNC